MGKQTGSDKPKRSRGRPSKYSAEFPDVVARLLKVSSDGLTNEALALYFGVNVETIKRWKDEHPEFCAAIKAAKDALDARVERSLFQRAIGYQHKEDKIFNHNGRALVVPTVKHYPPDTIAAIFWLKNRRPQEWRDRRELTGSDGGPLAVQIIDDVPTSTPQ
jgi:hypothetical protein